MLKNLYITINDSPKNEIDDLVEYCQSNAISIDKSSLYTSRKKIIPVRDIIKKLTGRECPNCIEQITKREYVPIYSIKCTEEEEVNIRRKFPKLVFFS